MKTSELKQYATNGLNVLFSGHRGTGKTTIVTEIFNDLYGKGNWAYLSGATVDPFLDLIGLPRDVLQEDGSRAIEYTQPKYLNTNIQAIFVDEYNRAHKKTRNAMLELMQSKSVNGRRYPNLKVVWAAINPADRGFMYDVDEVDPAQLDRFDVTIHMGLEPDKAYFKDTHGQLGESAVDWWNSLTDQHKLEVSPRRLEKALKHYTMIKNLKFVFPNGVNFKALEEIIDSNDTLLSLNRALDLTENDDDLLQAEAIITDIINSPESFFHAKKIIMANRKFIPLMVDLLPQEEQRAIISSADSIFVNAVTAYESAKASITSNFITIPSYEDFTSNQGAAIRSLISQEVVLNAVNAVYNFDNFDVIKNTLTEAIVNSDPTTHVGILRELVIIRCATLFFPDTRISNLIDFLPRTIKRRKDVYTRRNFLRSVELIFQTFKSQYPTNTYSLATLTDNFDLLRAIL